MDARVLSGYVEHICMVRFWVIGGVMGALVCAFTRVIYVHPGDLACLVVGLKDCFSSRLTRHEKGVLVGKGIAYGPCNISSNGKRPPLRFHWIASESIKLPYESDMFCR
jgi:hypothetical protein